MNNRQLYGDDMKKVVRILRGIPGHVSKSEEDKYRKCTKEAIHDLPRRLRASHFTLRTTTLCSTHKGFHSPIINDIWSWLKHELEDAIGRFLYPIIMSDRLDATEEFEVRQLEPVLQMWYRPWSLQQSAPYGRNPIQRGSKWAYQHDQCPACMMSRIGSDLDVLFAIFAGMVGRFNTRSLANAEAHGSVDAWEKTKSRRIRFVKYWLRATRDGEAMIATAGELGMKMKRLRREWKQEQRRLRHHQQFSPPRPRLGRGDSAVRLSTDPKIGPSPRPGELGLYSPAVRLGFGITASTSHISHRPATSFDASKRRPVPSRPPTATLPARSPSTDSHVTLCTTNSIQTVDLYPAPLRTLRLQPAPCSPSLPLHPERAQAHKDKVSKLPNSRYDSVIHSASPAAFSARQTNSHTPSLASSSTVLSYNGYPPTTTHIINPLDNPVHSPLPEAPQAIIHPSVFVPSAKQTSQHSYRGVRAVTPHSPFASLGGEDDAANTLPKPRTGSVYEAFGKIGWGGGDLGCVDELGREGSENDGEEEAVSDVEGMTGADYVEYWEDLH